MASRTFAPWIANLQQTGYLFNLIFLWLPSAEMAIARVQQRVTQGGHSVPEETIQRRYNSGIRNFFQLYRSLADNWRFYDNSNPAEIRLIASGRGIVEEVISENVTWDSIKKEFSS